MNNKDNKVQLGVEELEMKNGDMQQVKVLTTLKSGILEG